MRGNAFEASVPRMSSPMAWIGRTLWIAASHLAMQAALDPERVRLGLEAEVMVKLLRLPHRPDADRAMPPAKPDPAESAVD